MLTGVRVAVTRAGAQAAVFASLLEADGARVVICPLIRIVPAEDTGPLRAAAAAVMEYDWVVLTSVNAVRHFAVALAEAGTTASVRAVAAVGPATAAASEARGLPPAALLPADATGDALAAALVERLRGGAPRLLFPRARDASRTLPAMLRAHGIEVDEVECYRTLPDMDGAARLRAVLEAGACDVLAFTSPSQVQTFAAGVGIALAHDLTIAAIGPVTAAAARAVGLHVRIEAGQHTITGLVEALRAHYRDATGPAARPLAAVVRRIAARTRKPRTRYHARARRPGTRNVCPAPRRAALDPGGNGCGVRFRRLERHRVERNASDCGRAAAAAGRCGGVARSGRRRVTRVVSIVWPVKDGLPATA